MKNKDYSIDEDFLELYKDIFAQFDKEIINEPFIEHKLNNPPSYYPSHGIWFNDEDVSIRKRVNLSAEEE